MREKAISDSLTYASTCTYTRRPLNYADPVGVNKGVGPGALTSVFKLIRSQAISLRHRRHLPYDFFLERVRSQAYVSAQRTYVVNRGNPRFKTRDEYVGQAHTEKIPSVTLVDTEREGELINRCYANIKDMKVDLSVTLLEAKQTASLIGNTTRRLADGLNSIAKRDYKKAARTLKMRKPSQSNLGKSYADDLLAYQFGWVQLASDVSGAAMALHDILYRAPILSVKAKLETVREEFTSYTSKFNNHGDTWATLNSRFVGVDRLSVALAFAFDDDFLRIMSQLGLSNPVNTVWQTRPLSFLYGWLFSVDAVMASFDALAGLQFITGSTTQCTKGKVTTSFASVKWPYAPGLIPSSVQASINTIPGETDIVRMRRIVHETMPPPQFLITNPFSNKAVGKTLTSVAITRQLIEPELRRGR